MVFVHERAVSILESSSLAHIPSGTHRRGCVQLDTVMGIREPLFQDLYLPLDQGVKSSS